jgi:hypothetical protein
MAIELSLLAPLNMVLVDCRAGSRFNTKDASPHGRLYRNVKQFDNGGGLVHGAAHDG